VLLGRWGWLKSWANLDSLPGWLAYTGALWSINLIVLPGLFGLAAALARRIGNRQLALREVFIAYAYTLVPLGLAAWIAFSLSFVLVNGSYALPVLSDPFGWGWNLFGTASAAWTPLATNAIGFLQVGVLTVGLLIAVNTAYKIAHQHADSHRQAYRAMLPIAAFLTLTTLAFVVLYVG
jgi:hypothetical protein